LGYIRVVARDRASLSSLAIGREPGFFGCIYLYSFCASFLSHTRRLVEKAGKSI